MSDAYPTIDIICNAGDVHPGKPCVVRRFARTAPGEWVPKAWLVPDAEADLWIPADSHAVLDEATNADLRRHFRIPFKVRDTLQLRCYYCHRAGRYRPRRRGSAGRRVTESPLKA